MRLVVLVAILLAAPALATTAAAGPEWLPVCKDKDVRAFNTHVHVGVDCYPGIWVTHCPPVGDGRCYAVDVSLA